MEISLSDNTPVQQSYNAITKHDEVKSYIDDLRNEKLIIHSQLSYSSPVIVVTKKHDFLRLCCDYHKLNL